MSIQIAIKYFLKKILIRNFSKVCKHSINMIIYHYKKEGEKVMRRAIKRGLIVALGVIIQILLSLSVLIFFGQKIAVIETFYSILSVLLVLRHNKRK